MSATKSEYALMAGAAYFSTRSVSNRIPSPDGWEQLDPQLHLNRRQDDATGFEAVAFTKGTDIIISFAGTYDKSTADKLADAALGAGVLDPQLIQAALYYEEIKAAHPDANISFTGHSLGGGLAALMGVYFNKTAVTFDAAPFGNAAKALNQVALITNLALHGYGDGDLTTFYNLPYVGLRGRKKVSITSTHGQFLDTLPWSLLPKIYGGTPTILPHGATSEDPTDVLHSHALLIALLTSPQFTQDTYRLPWLVHDLFDQDLFARNSDTSERDLLTHLLRREFGVPGVPGSDVDLLTKFASDMSKLGSFGTAGQSVLEPLSIIALQHYSQSLEGSAREFFDKVAGGVRFDLTKLGDENTLLPNQNVKRYVDLLNWIKTQTPSVVIAELDDYLYYTPRRMTLGLASFINSTAPADNIADFMLSGSGGGLLAGNGGDDMLVGRGGRDMLNGGSGNDDLWGGGDADAYIWNSGDGEDTLHDGGYNLIFINGRAQKFFIRQDDGTWLSPDGKVTLTNDSTWKLNIQGGGSLDLGTTFNDGDYGLRLIDTPTASILTRTLIGDILPTDQDSNHSGVQIGYDDLGNIIGTAGGLPDNSDTLNGSENADLIKGLGGNDTLYGKGGADRIEGSTGQDRVDGGAGADLVTGNAGIDVLEGGTGNDVIYADSQVPLDQAHAQGETGTASSGRGDFLDGDEDDDMLVGSAARDLMSGGDGSDYMIGGAGNDLLYGDAHFTNPGLNWDFTVNASAHTVTLLNYGVFDYDPSVGGNDMLYGGAGNDWLLAQGGDDLLDGGAGVDELHGGAGNDILLGGDGNDYLKSGITNGVDRDWLDGGAGADRLIGSDGADVLIGATGSDILTGGLGKDTYLYNKGDGADTIIDSDIGTNASVVIFGSGVNQDSMKLRLGSLKLDFGDGDAVSITQFNSDNPLAYSTVESFQFADGTALTWGELLGRGFDIDGNDFGGSLYGTGVVDRITGGAAFDRMFGLDSNDILTGKGDADFINGGLGDDTYVFSMGDSPVIANPDPLKVGTETIYDNGGTDTIRFGAGIDPQNMKFANGGSVGFPPDLLIDYANPSSANVDRLLITDGQLGNIEYFEVTQVDGAIRKFSFTDFVGNYAAGMLSANEANGTRHVTAGKGNDFVTAGGSANSLLSGGAGNDTVVGGSGNDLLDGGTGNDRLSGDAGNDIYLFSAGDGHDEIDQVSSNSGDLDVVRFTDDVVPDDVSLSRNGDDLVLSLASGADTISLANWFSEGDVPARVSSVEFADGTVWDEQAIIDAVGNSSGSGVIEGSAGDDTLTGTSAAEEIRGLAGNDILIGGAGDDVLIGGAGSDLYRFTSGDDNDTVNEAAGESNVLELGAGITAADLSFEQTELGLVVRYAAADSVLLAGYDGSEDMTLRFADGSEVRLAELANRAPVSGMALADTAATADTAFSLMLPADAFGDADLGDHLSYAATRADGSALPAWLVFDAATRTLSGTPANADAGALELMLTATDRFGLTAGAGFSVRIGEHFAGNGYGDTRTGTANNDWLEGKLGNDNLSGGDGDDLIDGGLGSDVLAGGAGDDTFAISGTDTGYDSFQGDAGFDQVLGGSGDDTIRMYQFTGAKTVERIDGGAGANVVAGTGYGDTLDMIGTELVNIASIQGGDGNDTISGSAGNDTIFGDKGSDVLAGSAGDDTFRIDGTDTGYDSFQGDAGFDQVLGGSGDDTVRMYQFNGVKTVERIDGGAGINTIAGTGYGDTLDFSATELLNIASIQGGDGNDSITGSAGNDVISGDKGSDVLAGGAGDDTFRIDGTDTGYDSFQGDAGFDQVLGGIGDDMIRMYQFTGVRTVERIDGAGGTNIVAGTGYGDTLDFSSTELLNIAKIDVGDGNDTVIGSAGIDTIVGGIGSDVLAGGAGDDTFAINGSDAGYDSFQGDAGFDQVLGGAGDDTIRMYQFIGAKTVERIDGAAGTNVIAGTGYGDTLDFSNTELLNIASIQGGDGNDTITGSSRADTLVGGIGSDVLAGGAGDDSFLISGADNGYDSFQGDAGIDQVLGGTGDDTIRMYQFTGEKTVERIDGGAGTNVIAGTGYGDTLDFSSTELLNVAKIDGGDGNDSLTGSAGTDTLVGGLGSDVLAGGAGDDTFAISGTDTGYDSFQGDAGFDQVLGGSGDDTIRMYQFSGVKTVERIDGAGGTNVIAGTGYGDTLDMGGTELLNIASIQGGDGNDTITGSVGNDLILGGTGSDTLKSGAGSNFLFGDDGNDALSDQGGSGLLSGGAGADTLNGNGAAEFLIGGTGNDTINAGAGADVMAFNAGDGQDTLTADATQDNTLSLGGGISYANLKLSKTGNDLVLETGGTDQITLKNWYAATPSRSVLNLQVIAEAIAGFDASSSDLLLNKKIQNFDFQSLVNAYDTARVANATLAHWSAMNTLLDAHLSGSDDAALGGDLAYQYGRNGSLANIGVDGGRTVLTSNQFGVAPQLLQTQQVLQQGVARLG